MAEGFAKHILEGDHHLIDSAGVQADGLNELARSMRTFGWSRELKEKKQLEKKFPNIDPRFMFVNTGFNFREIRSSS